MVMNPDKFVDWMKKDGGSGFHDGVDDNVDHVVHEANDNQCWR